MPLLLTNFFDSFKRLFGAVLGYNLAKVYSPSLFLIQTETVPGIFCRIEDTKSAKKIFELKKRSPDKPLAVYSLNPEKYIVSSNVIDAFLKTFIDHSLTVILKANEKVPKISQKNGFVGIRLMNKSSALYQFLLKNKLTLLGTSANISGSNPILDINKALKVFPSAAVISENFYSGIPSTVVMLDDRKLTILRSGQNDKKVIEWAEKMGGVKLLDETKITYKINKK